MPRSRDNPKRRLQSRAGTGHAEAELAQLSCDARYKGSPYHKRNPMDYGLTPPAAPRPDASLCDLPCPVPRPEASELLRNGIRSGMISVQRRNGWPQTVWAVRSDGIVFEAELENQVQGHYHGYPLPEDDEIGKQVLRAWGTLGQ